MNCLPQMSCLRPRFPQNLTLKTPDIAQRVLSDLSVPPALAPANHLPLLTTLHSGHAVLPPTCLPSGSPLLAPLSRCPDPLRDTTGKTTITFTHRRVLRLPLFCRNTNAHPIPPLTYLRREGRKN